MNAQKTTRIVVLVVLMLAITMSGCDGSLGSFEQQTTWKLSGMQFGTKDLNLRDTKGNVVGVSNSQGSESAKRAALLNTRANKMFK